MKRFLILGIGATLTVSALAYALFTRLGIHPWSRIIRDGNASGLDGLLSKARGRMKPHFELAKVAYPPAFVTVAYFKDEQKLLLYAGDSVDHQRFIKGYSVLAASGTYGPKLKEGDLQVPEGVYRIELLNPKSRFHLSLRVNYPNAFDREQAKKDHRTQLGGDIMIHGGAASIGCIAIGDPAIEEVFAIAKDSNFRSWKVLLAPHDFRRPKPHAFSSPTPWVKDLYSHISDELARLPKE